MKALGAAQHIALGALLRRRVHVHSVARRLHHAVLQQSAVSISKIEVKHYLAKATLAELWQRRSKQNVFHHR